jgi:hypothetical protein
MKVIEITGGVRKSGLERWSDKPLFNAVITGADSIPADAKFQPLASTNSESVSKSNDMAIAALHQRGVTLDNLTQFLSQKVTRQTPMQKLKKTISNFNANLDKCGAVVQERDGKTWSDAMTPEELEKLKIAVPSGELNKLQTEAKAHARIEDLKQSQKTLEYEIY